MYHELTEQQIASRRRRITALVVAACLAVALCWVAWLSIDDDLHEQGAASVRQAIMNSAMQCCAIEGSYPASLSHLEKEYGLRINKDDYIITYEVFAGNVMPSVVVVPR